MPSETNVLAKGQAGDDPLNLDDQIGHLLRRAYFKTTSNLMARIGDRNLTPVQMGTLIRLREYGAISQNRLGRLVCMEPANIHSLVRRLEKRGLVSITRDPNDRRQLLVDLTEEGGRLVDELTPVCIEGNDSTLSPLTPKERETLYRLLRRLL